MQVPMNNQPCVISCMGGIVDEQDRSFRSVNQLPRCRRREDAAGDESPPRSVAVAEYEVLDAGQMGDALPITHVAKMPHDVVLTDNISPAMVDQTIELIAGKPRRASSSQGLLVKVRVGDKPSCHGVSLLWWLVAIASGHGRGDLSGAPCPAAQSSSAVRWIDAQGFVVERQDLPAFFEIDAQTLNTAFLGVPLMTDQSDRGPGVPL